MQEFYLFKRNIPRSSSDPYITGDGFRSFCDWVYDEESIFDPHLVQEKDRIFVSGNNLEQFFQKVHPIISKKYRLVVHNSEKTLTLAPFLKDQKIEKIFASNVCYAHSKVELLPRGIQNCHINQGDVEVLNYKRKKKMARVHLLYLNFDPQNNEEREKLWQKFSNASYAKTSKRKYFTEYLDDLLQSKFVLCPKGKHLDSYKIWLCLYLGSFPIIKSSHKDSLYKDLPILIVDNFDTISQNFLQKAYAKMRLGKYNLEKLTLSYWQKKFS